MVFHHQDIICIYGHLQSVNKNMTFLSFWIISAFHDKKWIAFYCRECPATFKL